MIKRLWHRCRPLFVNRGFRVLLILNVLLGLAYSFVGPFMSLFGASPEVGMSPRVFGYFMTVSTLAGVVVGTVLAHRSDAHSTRRSMLLVGSVAGALGYLGFAYVREFWSLLLISTLILGFSTITFSQLFAHAREALVREGVAKNEMAFYMNAFRMFFALSWTVGPAIASWVMVATGFRGLFLCASFCFVLFIIEVWRTVPALPPLGAKAARAESMFSLLARADVAAHFLGFVLVFASGTICMMNLPLMVTQVLHGDTKDVGIIYSLAPLFELPFMLYFGLLATRKSQTGIIRSGVIIVLVYYVLLCVVGAPWHIFPLQILSAAATAVVSGVAITYFQNYLPDHPGSATNLYSNAMRIGGTLGYLLFGEIAQRYGYRNVFVACSLFTLTALLLLWVPQRRVQAAVAIA